VTGEGPTTLSQHLVVRDTGVGTDKTTVALEESKVETNLESFSFPFAIVPKMAGSNFKQLCMKASWGRKNKTAFFVQIRNQ
jgi:hypothetical protein